jgi:hypothetical protein
MVILQGLARPVRPLAGRPEPTDKEENQELSRFVHTVYMVLMRPISRIYGGRFVHTVHIFHRFVLHLHHNCTSGEGKEGNLQMTRRKPKVGGNCNNAKQLPRNQKFMECVNLWNINAVRIYV